MAPNVKTINCRYLMVIGILNTIFTYLIIYHYIYALSNTTVNINPFLIHNRTSSTIYTKFLSNALINISIIESLSSFRFTCLSFPLLCDKYSIHSNKNINCLEILNTIHDSYFIQKQLISPLFILSLRREFIAYILFHKPNDECIVSVFDLFKSIHHSNFHRKSKYLIFHHHISKSAGTSIQYRQRQILKLLRENGSVPFGFRHSINNIKGGNHIFDKVPKNTFIPMNNNTYYGFKSCNDWYNAMVSHGIIRFGIELPLNKYGLCSEFYNAIVIRNPLKQFLSFLRHKLNLRSLAQILCKVDGDNSDYRTFEIKINNEFVVYSRCNVNIERMKGIINVILTQEYQVFRYRYGNTSYIDVFGKENEFAIFMGNFDNNGYMFNVKQMNGWLSNTYIRHIGYNSFEYRNKENIKNDIYDYNAMEIEPELVKMNHLIESNKILLCYDYVLIMDSVEYIWDYYLRETHRICKQQSTKQFDYTNDDELVFKNWSHVIRTNKDRVSHQDLRHLFHQSNEWNVLLHFNQLDQELWIFSQHIALLDVLFLTNH